MQSRLLLMLLWLPVVLHAQKDLSGSRRSSVYTYIYKVHPQEAVEIYQADLKKIDEKYLHTLTDSFLTAKYFYPDLPRGNYLFVHAVENKLQGELRTIAALQLKFIDNHCDFAVALHDPQGRPVKNATVFSGKKKVPFHPGSQTYLLNKRRSDELLQVYYQDVVHLFSLEKMDDWQPEYYSWTKRAWLKLRSIFQKRKYNNYEKGFNGFIAFNKPKYKPGDTVKLKAWITDRKGTRVDRPLLLRLSERGMRLDSVLATVAPYRAGGYEFDFVLQKGLNLKLDREFSVTLEEVTDSTNRNKVLMRGKFRYEEYDLTSVSFAARTDQQEHQPGSPVSIYCKATDENNLPVMDGRVSILVRPTYGTRQFHQWPVFLPDTLWTHEQLLENVGETKIILPEAVFPAVTTPYEIICTFLNSNNERHTVTLNQQFKYVQELIKIEQQQDSLRISLMKKGQSIPVNATVYAFNSNDDTVQQWSVSLPVAIHVHPYAESYEVNVGDLVEFWEPEEEAKQLVTSISYRTRDSLFLKVINPLKLPFWYTLLAGKKVISRGAGDSLWIAARTHTKQPYHLSLQYIYADKVQEENITIPFYEKILNVAVDQPEFVYPGQQAGIAITITDVNGQPVADADITSWAVTSKLKQQLPRIPYHGKLFADRRLIPGFEVDFESQVTGSVLLNWQRWSKSMGLDSIEYFKFLHPQEIYSNTEPTPNGITQIAPFVVKNGELQPVHQVYIDEVPSFFSQAQHLQQYSLPTYAGKHALRLRTPDYLITIDSVWVAADRKTIICINADSSNKRINLLKRPDTLSTYEMQLWSKYLLLVENNFGHSLVQVTQNNTNYVLNFPGKTNISSGTTLVGPLPYGISWLDVKNKFRQSFETEGGYTYQIFPGLIKQKQWQRENWPFQAKLSRNLRVPDFRDHVLSAGEIDSLWQDYLDHRSAREELFRNPSLSSIGNGRLYVSVSKGQPDSPLLVKQRFLFRYDQPDFIRAYTGVSDDLGYLTPGYYRLCLLLKNNQYFLMDSLLVRNNGINYYETGIIVSCAPDSFSLKMASIIESRESVFHQPSQSHHLSALNQTFNSAYLDQSSFTRIVWGRITGDMGEPLVGVTVTIKSTGVGTVTDKDGYFRLKVPEKGTLTAAYVGYSPVEKKIGTGDQYDFVLIASANELQEVVVIGYGTRRRRDITGSITQVSSELQGMVPGIYLRGISTPSSKFGRSAGQLLQNQILNEIPDIAEIPAVANTLRKNFRDDAWWQPTLRTGNDGRVSFTTRFPDDITRWRTFIIAMGDNKTSGYHEGNIRSFKPVSAVLALPNFIIKGDSAQVIGKVMNYINDSIQVVKRFELDGQLQQETAAGLRHAIIDTFRVTGSSNDSLKLKYTISKTDGYFDGEERTIPVFRPGVLEARGAFGILMGDSGMVFSPDPAMGKVKLYAEISVLPVLLDEIDRIGDYEYLCNEQMASKLKALVLKKRIYQHLKKPFREENQMKYLIGKLSRNKVQEGLWGWWPGNRPILWISQHVIEALLMAEKEGFPVELNKTVITDQMVLKLEQPKSTEMLNTLRFLELLQAKIDWKKYTDTLEKLVPVMSQYEKLQLLHLKQKAGLPAKPDSLIKQQQRTLFGATHWGEESYRFFNNSVQNTLLMYRILKQAGGYDQLLRSTRQYFMEVRSNGHWRNTYEASLILETILPDLLSEVDIQQRAGLVIEGRSDTITSFPFTTELSPQQTVRLWKKGGLPLYVGLHQEGWNALPQKASNAFDVKSFFESNGDTVATLKAGVPVVLKVVVKVTADAEYVMVEAPVPAGCSYKSKEQGYGQEDYREYFKNKVSIFCSNLPRGTYTFQVSLLPRFTGVYHLNPAKAELMYFPIFYGREGMKRVSIR